MAVGRGWINRPAPLLTAYTASGGKPRLWQSLAKARGIGELKESEDRSEESSRRNFINWRTKTVATKADQACFDKAYLALYVDAAKILERLAEHPNGVRWSTLMGLFNDQNRSAKERHRQTQDCPQDVDQSSWNRGGSRLTCWKSQRRCAEVANCRTNGIVRSFIIAKLRVHIALVGRSFSQKAVDRLSESEGFALEC